MAGVYATKEWVDEIKRKELHRGYQGWEKNIDMSEPNSKIRMILAKSIFPVVLLTNAIHDHKDLTDFEKKSIALFLANNYVRNILYKTKPAIDLADEISLNLDKKKSLSDSQLEDKIRLWFINQKKNFIIPSKAFDQYFTNWSFLKKFLTN